MRSHRKYWWLIVPAVMAWTAVAVAQVSDNGPPSPSAVESSTEDASPRIVERSPRIIYLRNAKGEEVPWINLPLERIQTLLDRDNGGLGRRQPPEYQVDRLEINGRTEQSRAVLDVAVDVTTLKADDSETARWVAVPLRMHDSSLVEPPSYEGGGQMFLSQDESDGYQAWIRFKQTGQHKIRLRFWTNLSKAALATQLRFFPPAANISVLRLDVVGSPINADIENGANLQVSRGEEERSILTATDLRNQVAVVWRDGNTDTQQRTAYLDARGDIQVSIDGPGAIRSNVTLDVKSYTGAIESFALRLPPYTTIVAVSDEDYQITELSNPTFEQGDNRRTVQVTLDEPSTQIQLQLTTQTTVAANGDKEGPGAEQLINVASFEVLDALRQAGRVSVLASEDWLVYWYLGSSVRRVPGPGDSSVVSERKRLATFEYFRQPCRLDLEIKPQSTRVHVEPIYRIKVEEDRVALEATLRYKIRGARVSFLDFALNGWQLDDVGPSTTVENDHFQDDSNPNVKLRLTQPRAGEVDLVLNLHRRVTEREGTLRFPLPWPASDSLTPGMVLVTAADAIALNYRTQEMVGLVQDTVPTDIGSASRLSSTQQLAAFRIRHDRAPGDVVIDYQVREQELSVRSDTVVEVSPGTANVSQQFSYKVLYEPASRLTLEIPRPLYEWMADPRNQNQVELDVAGRSLNIDTLLDANNGLAENESSVSLSVPLDQPQLGSFVVRLQFPWKLIASNEFRQASIPLATPRDGRLLSNTAKLSAKGRSRIELTDDSRWEEDENAATLESSPMFALTAQGQRDEVTLNVKQIAENDEVVIPGTTVVQLAWRQTWLSRAERRDRLAYRITTGADRLYLNLPGGENPQLIVLVDGREAAATFNAADELEIPLPQGARRHHTIEVSLRYATRPKPGGMSFRIPSFRDAQPVERWFWQLILPDSEELLLTDSRLTSANHWQRDGWFWTQIGSVNQPNLEYMTGASTQVNVPGSANQYLFSSFDPINEFEIRTCRRRVLVYGTSSLILLMGLSLIYVPVTRQPIVLMIIGVGLATSVALLPTASVLIAQASLLGCALVILSLLILVLVRWVAMRRLAGQPRQSESPSGVQSSWRDGSQSSTASITVQSLPVVVPDSKA